MCHILVSRIFTFTCALQILRLPTALVNHLELFSPTYMYICGNFFEALLWPLTFMNNNYHHHHHYHHHNDQSNCRQSYLPPLCRLPLLLFLQLLSGFLSQQKLKEDFLKKCIFVTFIQILIILSYHHHQPRFHCRQTIPKMITLSFFFLSGVMKPFLFFFPAA